VKEVRGLLSPFIPLLLEKSLSIGLFPIEFKEAIVCLLLKKSVLDSTQKKNYRPVSNLSFLSKLLERAAQAVEVFQDCSDLMPTMQSAYRRCHSTETAVLKIYDDLLLAADNGDESALCLLDLTAAFNTVDHDLVMLKLECQFGLRGVILDWFRSYLCGRTYRVIHHVICSVPQGSVLGPRMFILCAANLEDVAAKHSVNIYGYADDTQLYLHGCRDDMTSTVHRLESCITDVGQWMSAKIRLSYSGLDQDTVSLF